MPPAERHKTLLPYLVDNDLKMVPARRLLKERAHVDDNYINRNMIGVIASVPPFDGDDLSGTGFKAGGFFISRFVTECTVTTNTSALAHRQGGHD